METSLLMFRKVQTTPIQATTIDKIKQMTSKPSLFAIFTILIFFLSIEISQADETSSLTGHNTSMEEAVKTDIIFTGKLSSYGYISLTGGPGAAEYTNVKITNIVFLKGECDVHSKFKFKTSHYKKEVPPQLNTQYIFYAKEVADRIYVSKIEDASATNLEKLNNLISTAAKN